MPILVRTPVQHDLGVTSTPCLTSFQYLTSQTRDYRSLPHSQSECLEKIILAKIGIMYYIHVKKNQLCPDLNNCIYVLYVYLVCTLTQKINIFTCWTPCFMRTIISSNKKADFFLENNADFSLHNWRHFSIIKKNIKTNIKTMDDCKT